jgi:hypothetical protein
VIPKPWTCPTCGTGCGPTAEACPVCVARQMVRPLVITWTPIAVSTLVCRDGRLMVVDDGSRPVTDEKWAPYIGEVWCGAPP